MTDQADSKRRLKRDSDAGVARKPRPPRRLLPDVVARVLARHAAGTYLVEACALEGVSDDALLALRRRDPSVAAAYDAAHAEWVELHRARIAASRDWKAQAWLLSRGDPRFREEAAPVALPSGPQVTIQIAAGDVQAALRGEAVHVRELVYDVEPEPEESE
jgi:hypothetical protein